MFLNYLLKDKKFRSSIQGAYGDLYLYFYMKVYDHLI